MWLNPFFLNITSLFVIVRKYQNSLQEAYKMYLKHDYFLLNMSHHFLRQPTLIQKRLVKFNQIESIRDILQTALVLCCV